MSQNQTLRTTGIAAGRDYQELPAWQKSMTVAEQLYTATEHFPDREHAGLAAQIRTLAISIPAAIAAASGRNNEFGMTDSYSKAQSANAELYTLHELAKRMGYLIIDFTEQLDEVGRLLTGMKHGLKVAAKDAERAERDASKAERDVREERKERDDRPRREYKPRDGGSERPRREYKPRDDRGGEERPRREYKPRDSGGEDRPRREYKPRDGAAGGEDRPRREYKPRDSASGDRKPYGDKKPYGEKKPYGDRKPYGDKKPYGDRKPYGDKKPFSGGKKPYKPRDRD